MASYSETYYAASGYAYSKGVNDFEKHMPRDLAYSLIKGWLYTAGFKWTEMNAISYLASIAGRRERAHERETKRPCPPDGQRCTWFKSMDREFHSTLRATALRCEVTCPEPRCGFALKEGHLGGVFFDYKPCIKPIEQGRLI